MKQSKNLKQTKVFDHQNIDKEFKLLMNELLIHCATREVVTTTNLQLKILL